MSIAIDLTGRTALITGGSQGIGAEVGRTLHRAGASVVINHPDQGGGKTQADAQALAAELNALRDGSALVWAADVGDPAAVERMMKGVQTQVGGIDILVNNAGILRQRSVGKLPVEDWDDVLRVNLSGVFLCCKYGLEVLRDGGAIVCVGSLAADVGFHGQACYAATKGGIHSLVRVLATECARRSIRVNAVAPGIIDTAILAGTGEEALEHIKQTIALRRIGQPREVADAILFLCSPLASYITGHILAVDGGYLG